MPATDVADDCGLEFPRRAGAEGAFSLIGRETAMVMAMVMLLGCLLGGCGTIPPGHQGSAESAAVGPAHRLALPLPQPDAAAGLKPGLAVVYYPGFSARHLDLLPDEASFLSTKGIRGQPIPYLNHRFGGAPIFGSGCNSMVGMRMNGWLFLEAAGTYLFQALSNDGVRVMLGGLLILDDPLQHGDQLSNAAPVAIQTPGWYPIRVEYFQRKGTATLEFHWRPPGAPAFSPVPAEVLAHSP